MKMALIPCINLCTYDFVWKSCWLFAMNLINESVHWQVNPLNFVYSILHAVPKFCTNHNSNNFIFKVNISPLLDD
jgi:hypothetical protein